MTITKGNFYDSRNKNILKSIWTTGYDVCIEDGDKKYFYQLRNHENERVTRISPVFMDDSFELSWDELNINIRKAHFRTINPNGSEEEMNIFVYGMLEGEKLNADAKNLDSHIVYNSAISSALVRKIGRFESVKLLYWKVDSPDGKCRTYCYVIDNKWHVAVSTKNYLDISSKCTYEIETYSDILKGQKTFGRRVARLAEEAGVPWEVAQLVGNIQKDDEAIKLLNMLKNKRGKVNSYMKKELLSDLYCRTGALRKIVGDTWDKLQCNGQKKTLMLAVYLIGE